MAPETINRQMLIDYLLGTIPETDQLTLAEHLLADEELSDQLLEVQADLVDQYVRGQLSPDEARRLESYLDRLPGGRRKIVVAQALMKIAEGEQPAATTEVQPSKWWRSALLPAGRLQLRLAHSVLAVLIVLVIGGIWLVKHNRRQNLERMIAAGQKQPNERSPELANSQQGAASREGEAPGTQVQVQGPRIAEPPASAPKTLIISLTPFMRGSSSPVARSRGPNTKFVILRAPLDRTEKYIEYRASIRTTTDHPTLQEQAFHPLRNKNRVDIRLAARDLPPATYKLTLWLRTADAGEAFRVYYFVID